MNTDELIARLASAPSPHSAASLHLRFALPLLGAALLALALLTAAFGAPLAEIPHTGVAPFAMKLGFGLALLLASGAALFTSGRPGTGLRGRLALIALPFALVIALASAEGFAGQPAWPGATWMRCLGSIALLTPLAYGGAVLALRRLAPTRLRLSGALAGLLAASTAASAYALWCPETGALFLLSWYAAPIALAGAIGALAGPRLLRW